jgi:hypothetical protein
MVQLKISLHYVPGLVENAMGWLWNLSVIVPIMKVSQLYSSIVGINWLK